MARRQEPALCSVSSNSVFGTLSCTIPAADADVGGVVPDLEAADRDATVELAVHRQVHHGAAVVAAVVLFQLRMIFIASIFGLRSACPCSWSPGTREGVEVGQECP